MSASSKASLWGVDTKRLGTLVLVNASLGIILLACIRFLTDQPLLSMFTWLEQQFGPVFITLFTALTITGIWAIKQMSSELHINYWYEVAQQVGNAIATLALTFTLLGISLGIATLAETPLTPESIQLIISQLTHEFSLAFMTTVIGLPTATIIRAISAIQYQKLNAVSLVPVIQKRKPSGEKL